MILKYCHNRKLPKNTLLIIINLTCKLNKKRLIIINVDRNQTKTKEDKQVENLFKTNYMYLVEIISGCVSKTIGYAENEAAAEKFCKKNNEKLAGTDIFYKFTKILQIG